MANQQTTVRVDRATHRILRAMRRETGDSTSTIVAKAVSEYRRRQFLHGLNDDYAALRRNPQAWRDLQDERAAWDATLADGLDD